jgi:hypothetical protein
MHAAFTGLDVSRIVTVVLTKEGTSEMGCPFCFDACRSLTTQAPKPNRASSFSFYGHKFPSRRCNHNRGATMGVQRVWKPVGANPRQAEIEQLHRELAAFNERIAEIEKARTESPTIETLKASAIVLARQIDEVRCSLMATS